MSRKYPDFLVGKVDSMRRQKIRADGVRFREYIEHMLVAVRDVF
jgi:hypothetical protein